MPVWCQFSGACPLNAMCTSAMPGVLCADCQRRLVIADEGFGEPVPLAREDQALLWPATPAHRVVRSTAQASSSRPLKRWCRRHAFTRRQAPRGSSLCLSCRGTELNLLRRTPGILYWEVSSIPAIIDLVCAGNGHAVLGAGAVVTSGRAAELSVRPISKPKLASVLCLAVLASKRATPLGREVAMRLPALARQYISPPPALVDAALR